MPRTLQTLCDDYSRFISQGGGYIKMAKKYNNVIGPYFFDIPLKMYDTFSDNFNDTNHKLLNRCAYLDYTCRWGYTIGSGHCWMMRAMNWT